MQSHHLKTQLRTSIVTLILLTGMALGTTSAQTRQQEDRDQLTIKAGKKVTLCTVMVIHEDGSIEYSIKGGKPKTLERKNFVSLVTIDDRLGDYFKEIDKADRDDAAAQWVLAEAPDSRIALASLAIVSVTASPDDTASFCDDYIERFDDSPFVRIQRAELRDASAPQKAQIDRDRANILLSQPCPSIELRAALHPNVMREAYYGLTLDTFVHGFNAIYLFRRGQWGPALAELGKTVMSTSRGKAFAHRFLDEVQVAVGPESPLQPTIAVLREQIR